MQKVEDAVKVAFAVTMGKIARAAATPVESRAIMDGIILLS